MRLRNWISLPLTREEGGSFGFSHTPLLMRPLHQIDRSTGDDLLREGAQSGTGVGFRKQLRAMLRSGDATIGPLIATTIMDEATESALMEGASTTRTEAIAMLRDGRAPRTLGERMVANNLAGMHLIKDSLSQPLSPEFIRDLHTTLCERTLDDEGACGRYRLESEKVLVVDGRDSSTIHVPPHASRVPKLIEDLCAFANDAGGEPFIHPIIKASILHFMLGYIHPFVDGNGRTARALFYWHALRSGYSIFELLSISTVIRRGFAKYPRAYLDSEQDDGDLTYFILYQLDVIAQALRSFGEHLARQVEHVRESEKLLSISRDLNFRQRLILSHSLRHPQTLYTVLSHSNSNNITKVTARNDLEDLVRRKLMTTSKRGKEVIYHPAPTLRAKLDRKSR
jgi:Fic family protein